MLISLDTSETQPQTQTPGVDHNLQLHVPEDRVDTPNLAQ